LHRAQQLLLLLPLLLFLVICAGICATTFPVS
jgi:hypothetical protein